MTTAPDDPFAGYSTEWVAGYNAGIVAFGAELNAAHDKRLIALPAELEVLRSTLRYIAAQAKAGHAGALRVIQSNAEAALDGSLAKMQAAASQS